MEVFVCPIITGVPVCPLLGAAVSWTTAWCVLGGILIVVFYGITLLLEACRINENVCQWTSSCFIAGIDPIVDLMEDALGVVLSKRAAGGAAAALSAPIFIPIYVSLSLVEAICIHPFRLLARRPTRRLHTSGNPNEQ